MTYEEIIAAHKAGKLLVASSIECAKGFEVEAVDNEQSAKDWAASYYEGSDFEFVEFEDTDIEVPDTAGHYNGSKGPYSLIHVNCAVTRER